MIFRVLPPDPIALIISGSAFGPPEAGTGTYYSPTQLWGMNQPLPVQYLIYLRNMLTFTFGQSFTEGFRLVIELVILRLPHSLILMGSAALLTLVLGLVTSSIAATRSGGKFEGKLATSALGLDLLPGPWLGMILLLFFTFYFPILPFGGLISDPGYRDPLMHALDIWYHLILPIITLTLIMYGSYILIMEYTLDDRLAGEHIEIVFMKGVDERALLSKYAIRNETFSPTTIVAFMFGSLIGGLIFTETVLNRYGIGSFIIESVIAENYPVLQATFFILAFTTVLVKFNAEVLQEFLNPFVPIAGI